MYLAGISTYFVVYARIAILVVGIALYWYVICMYLLVSVCIDDNRHFFPCAVSLGCTYDEARSEPGSWLDTQMGQKFKIFSALFTSQNF